MVNVKITHDPNNAGPREERMANLDVAASHAITFGITCTITVPREPRSGRPVEQVYSFVAGVLLQGEGHPVVTEDSLAWWCRRASEPYRGSSVAFVTLRDAAGKVWPRVTVRGAGGLVGLAERYRLLLAGQDGAQLLALRRDRGLHADDPGAGLERAQPLLDVAELLHGLGHLDGVPALEAVDDAAGLLQQLDGLGAVGGHHPAEDPRHGGGLLLGVDPQDVREDLEVVGLDRTGGAS
jgi:hypothetical protein